MILCRNATTLIFAAMLAVAGGCNRSSSPSYTTYGYDGREPASERQRTETRHTERRSEIRSQQQAWKTADRRDMKVQSMAFPTGDQSSSVLLVTKQMPSQIRAGAPFEYQLTVQNISDQPLEGVVVYDRVPSEITVRVAERDEKRIISQQVTEERFVVREYEPGVAGRDPFLPRYTPLPVARELSEGEVYAVDRTGRRTAEGRTQLGPGDETVAGVEPRDSAARPARQQIVEQRERRVETREQRIEARGQEHAVHAVPRDHAFLAGEWYIGHLAPKATRTLTLTGTAPSAGALATCTTVAYQPTICLVSQVVEPQLRLERIAPEQADACEEITITYRVTNTGTGTATGIVIQEQLPEGQTLAADNQRNVRFELRELPEGRSQEFTARTKVARRGEYRGSAQATDAYEVTVKSQESVTRAVAPQLEVELTAPQEAFTARPLNYTLRVTNKGDAPARDLNVRLAVPQGARMLNAGQQGQLRAGNIAWDRLQVLQPGQSIDLTAGIDIQQAGDVRATATADAHCAEPASDTAQTSLQAVGSLLLEVVDTNDPVPLNSNEVYRIRVTSQGDKADTNIRLVVTLPDEMELANQRAAVQPQIEARTLTFVIPRLEARTAETIEITARAVQAGDVRFKVEMTSDELTAPVIATEATRLY
jgi:uncharacterized repeat protein (TIGR01451 family)